MGTIFAIWYLMGIVGSSLFFYDDLESHYTWDVEMSLTIGDILIGLIIALGGPIALFFGLKETRFIGDLMKHLGEYLEKILNTEIVTIRKRKDESK